MKFKFVGEEPRDFGGIGHVEPGQVFEVHEDHADLFRGTILFEEVKEQKVNKKKKEGE